MFLFKVAQFKTVNRLLRDIENKVSLLIVKARKVIVLPG
jgi:hypothetical protein